MYDFCIGLSWLICEFKHSHAHCSSVFVQMCHFSFANDLKWRSFVFKNNSETINNANELMIHNLQYTMIIVLLSSDLPQKLDVHRGT